MNSLLFDTLDNAHSSYSFRALSLLTFFSFLPFSSSAKYVSTYPHLEISKKTIPRKPGLFLVFHKVRF